MPLSVFDRSQYFGGLHNAVQQHGWGHRQWQSPQAQDQRPVQQPPPQAHPGPSLNGMFAQQAQALPPGIVGQVDHLPPAPPIAPTAPAGAALQAEQTPDQLSGDRMAQPAPQAPLTPFGTALPSQAAAPAQQAPMAQQAHVLPAPALAPWAAPNPAAPPIQQAQQASQPARPAPAAAPVLGEDPRMKAPGGAMPKPADFMGPLRTAAGGGARGA